MNNFKQKMQAEGRDYMLQKFADERADVLIGPYWREYMMTGYIVDFDLDAEQLERSALMSGIGDLQTVLREHIKREVIVTANNSDLPRAWRIALLGHGDAWD